MIDYINHKDWLADLRASHTNFPIAKKGTIQFLATILASAKPKKVLEIGTGVGFSAIFMAKYIEDIHITTIERHQMMIDKAKFHFDIHGVTHKIKLIEDNAIYALENLEKAKQSYDLIFLDAAKGQYINFLPHILNMLPTGAILISDNILQIVQKDYNTIEKRKRTIYNNMTQFIQAITTMVCLETIILPIEDGVGFSVRL